MPENKADRDEYELRHELCDMAVKILIETHDGADLTWQDKGLLQCAVLHQLNEDGIQQFKNLYGAIISGQYKCWRAQQWIGGQHNA